jgi:ABC-type transport system involved in cytochrome bd biosynthesis, fused ATPase and permease components
MNKKFSWKHEHWVKPYLAKYKWNFLLAIFLGIVMFFCGGALMFYAGYTIDKAATRPENILMIYVPIVLMRAVGIGRPLFRYLERLVSHNWILRVTSSLRRRLFYIAEKTLQQSAQLFRQEVFFLS